MSPLRTANMNGVVPALDFAWMSAPNSISVSMTGACPSAAAHISAVCPFHVFLRVEIGAGLREHLYRVDASGARRVHQRRFSGVHEIYRVVRLGACLEKLLDDGRAALLSSERQRSDAKIVFRIDFRAGAHQQCGRVGVVQIGRPMEGGRAIALRALTSAPLLIRDAAACLSPRSTASASGAYAGSNTGHFQESMIKAPDITFVYVVDRVCRDASPS